SARIHPLFFANHPATTAIYTLSLHDALPISGPARVLFKTWLEEMYKLVLIPVVPESHRAMYSQTGFATQQGPNPGSINLSMGTKDRKSTRLNSSHVKISYAVFCLKKKTT